MKIKSVQEKTIREVRVSVEAPVPEDWNGDVIDLVIDDMVFEGGLPAEAESMIGEAAWIDTLGTSQVVDDTLELTLVFQENVTNV